MNGKVLVYLIDDDHQVRSSFSELVRSIGLGARVYPSAEPFLSDYDPKIPSCVVIDVCMPGMSGLTLQQALLARRINVPVIIVTGHADVPMAVEAMSKGAFGFLEKPYRAHELTELIKKAISKDYAHRRHECRMREISEGFLRLSDREREVLQLVASGNPNKVIATRLGISQRTVEIHRSNLMEKLHARSVADLVRFSMEHESIRNQRS